MNVHGKSECRDQSTLTLNDINSKSDEAIPDQKQQYPIDFLIVTRVPEKTYKFQWIIRQFSTLPKNEKLYSTCINTSATSSYLKLVKYEHGFGLFHESQKSREKNQIDFQPIQTSSSQVGLTLSSGYHFASTPSPIVIQETAPKASNTKENIMLEYQLSASDGSGKELTKWSVRFSNNSESEDSKIGEYVNSTLENFPNDSLILDCNLKVVLIPLTEEMPIASKPSLECNGWKKLSMDLKALYQNSLDTDITLIVEADKICAHKSILTARSPVFKKIFHHDMEEAEQHSVVITDVEFSALQTLVEYLYTGVILECRNKDMDLQELYNLYYAADKYEVMDLREMTGNTLLSRIQVANASEILVWTDRHNDKDLKFKIMNFIRLNFEAVLNTDTWESCALHHPSLAAEVVNFCAKKLKTSDK